MDRANIIHSFLLMASTILMVTPVLVTSQLNSTLFVGKGCFYDNFEYDVLPDLIQCEGALHQSCINTCTPKQPYCQSDDMTPELCFQICTNQNARYFGLQDGSQCLCGGAFAPYDSKGPPPADSACSKNCTGDQTQMCGESFQVSVYEIKDPASDCFHPGYLNVGEDIYPPVNQGDFIINDTLDYSTICVSPSTLTGTSTITCTENNWSGALPVCTIRCSPPDPLPYVVFESVANRSFNIGETVSYTCLGNATNIYNTECDSTGLWLPTDCPVVCAKTNLPPGGALATTSHLDYFAMGALVDFVCDGVSLIFTFRCGSFGNWNTSAFTCPDVMTTVASPPTTPSNDRTTSSAFVNDMTSLEPTGSTTGVGPTSESNQGWVIAVAVVVPLIIILIVIMAFCCYRKRKEEQNKHVPQVVLGYIKKKGTLGGTLRRNRDPEKDLTDNPEGEADNIKKGGTLTHSLSSMKQQFVKRVTLNRNRPELPPKKNPKKSSSRSVTSHAEVGYVSPKGARTDSEVEIMQPNPPPVKRFSTVSIVSSVDNGLDEVFKSELRTSRSSEMLDALMVEFDGRVNHGFDNEESSARSSPSLPSKNSPTTEHVVVHIARPSSPKPETPKVNGFDHDSEQNGEVETVETGANLQNGEDNLNPDPEFLKSDDESDSHVKGEPEAAVVNGGYLDESPYDSLGEPKPAPPEILKANGIGGEGGSPHESAKERNRPSPLTLTTNGGSDHEGESGPESPKYASLADMKSPNGGIGVIGSPSATPTKHDYVNVGRGNSVSAMTRISAEFHHPRPPSLPPDSP
ncbi:uncharacterized protein LOC121430676 [Lytechinus variegatus]|uniref:uncharacterized protein LOC121430676 n=1 Tax=Lytechinus variegatus TaxID=7654 RepID=UPI001BB2474B|nr:uncharacterized protein LOC121430676 [Lytechinus variegatus]